MKEIRLTQGEVALVDDEDYERLSRFKWRTLRHHGRAYAVTTRPRSKRKAVLFMHRLILPPKAGFLLDHKDRDGLNNQSANLRYATPSQSTVNTVRQRRISPYRGIRLIPPERTRGGRPRWRTVIEVEGQFITLGHFACAEEAARAYDDAARRYYGEFAVLNFPCAPCPDRC